MNTALQTKTKAPMSNSKPRIHVVTGKVDIDTLNKVKAEANRQGETVSAFISRAVQNTLKPA